MPLNLDEIKAFLAEVQAGATSEPSTFATTAITHFKNLLDTALQLTAAVEHQTRAIQALLETDLAAVTTPPLVPMAPPPPPPAGYYPYPYQAPPPPQQPQMPPGWQQPYIPGQNPYIQPPQSGGWVQHQPQLAQSNPAPQVTFEFPPQVADYGEPAQYLPAGPVRNGQVIQPAPVSENYAEALSAAPPPIPGMWAGGRAVRTDRV